MTLYLDLANRDENTVAFSNGDETAYLNISFEQWEQLGMPVEIEL